MKPKVRTVLESSFFRGGIREPIVILASSAQLIENENKELKEKISIAEKALQKVLSSALHPDIAIRAMMVELAPVREALNKIKNEI